MITGGSKIRKPKGMFERLKRLSNFVESTSTLVPSTVGIGLYIESILSCQTSSLFETVASKNPSSNDDFDIINLQSLGFEAYLSKRYFASTLSFRISML